MINTDVFVPSICTLMHQETNFNKKKPDNFPGQLSCQIRNLIYERANLRYSLIYIRLCKKFNEILKFSGRFRLKMCN